MSEYGSSAWHFTETLTSESVKMSVPFLSFGFTHTFKWGEDWGR